MSFILIYVCSGGIIGMGEIWEDRIDMALDLSEVPADSITGNMLTTASAATIQGDIDMLRSMGRSCGTK